ncbi:DUF58 domain-containing protein [Rhodobacter sp. KR11]|uniref:DUF58 domain-containing protein n=1 Tax=Rhodobacter sp. KR11 TaxID=2974588 RepID=UPI00222373CD|nr:DUF58 domain-containing protein [Rhodobacter sp. KR11]MCW1918297.1 DUF58 domain-containing protein [Rhodobacter sp. KR11]
MRPGVRLLALVTGLLALSILLLVGAGVDSVTVAAIWGALALMAVLDMIATPPGRRLSLTADLPPHGFAGHDVALTLTLTGPATKALALRVTHGPGLQAPRPDGVTERKLTLPLTILRRGAHRVTGLEALYPSRLGLFDIIARWPLDLTVTGLPDIHPILSGAIQTQVLPLIEGSHAMTLRGEGSDFHQLRDFVPGMDRRTIDWKRSARMRKLVSRETRAERNHQIVICLDTGHLMGARLGALARLDHAIHAGLALTWAGVLAGDVMGFFSFGPRPGAWLPPLPGQKSFARIRAHAADLTQDDAETNHTLGLTSLAGHLKRRTLVIVFSDFSDSVTAELLVENLTVMRRQHLILYVSLRDPDLDALSTPTAPGLTPIAAAIAARRMARERQAVLDRLQRLGILCLDTTPGDLTPALISRYMDIKAREMI